MIELELKNLTVVRNSKLLFRDLSCLMSSGELWQISGPNGQGKTTLLRTMLNLYAPQQGDVLYQGASINKVYKKFCEDLVYIGHKSGISMQLTILENINYWCQLLNSRAEFAVLADSLNSVMRALTYFQMSQLMNRPCHQLSSGQLKKISLTRLLLLSGRIWILDEPFASLDHKAISQLKILIKEHVKAGGLVIFTSHQKVDFDALTVQNLVLE